MKKLFVLKNIKGEIIRFFRCETDQIYLVYRKDKKRLDFCSSPTFFEKESVVLVDEIDVAHLKTKTILSMNAILEVYNPEDKIRTPLDVSQLSKDAFHRFVLGLAMTYVLLGTLIYSLFDREEKFKASIQETKIVEIKKAPLSVKVQEVSLMKNQKNLISTANKSKNQVKKSLKQIGVLSVLGNSSKNQNKGGLSFRDDKSSPGPGVRAIAFKNQSGKMRSQIYSEGMITAGLGTGGNIKGGGGHGTKGIHQDGGLSGYGELSLITSAGTEDLSSTLNSQGSNLDFNFILKEILNRRNSLRDCYLRVLKTEPDIKGFFEFTFQVNKQGKVVSSKLNPSSPVQSSAMSSCIFKVINKIKFSIRLDSEILINYSFDLSQLEN